MTCLKIGSVASIFVSRIDVAVDKRLDKLGDKSAGGPAARQGGDRQRETRLSLVTRRYSPARAGKPGRGGREDAAAALGVHQHQKPGLQGHDVCRGADRPRHGGHHPAGDDGRLPRSRGRYADAIEQDIAGARAMLAELESTASR